MNTAIVIDTVTISFHCDRLHEIHRELHPTVETIVFSLGEVEEYTPAFVHNFLSVTFTNDSYVNIGKAKIHRQLTDMADTMLTATKLFPKETFND